MLYNAHWERRVVDHTHCQGQADKPHFTSEVGAGFQGAKDFAQNRDIRLSSLKDSLESGDSSCRTKSFSIFSKTGRNFWNWKNAFKSSKLVSNLQL